MKQREDFFIGSHGKEIPFFLESHRKCPQHDPSRTFKEENQTVESCSALCSDNEDCKYFSIGTRSSDYPGVCIGCENTPSAVHNGFDSYSMKRREDFFIGSHGKEIPFFLESHRKCP